MKEILSNKLFKHSARTIAVLILLACAGGPADLNEFTSYFLPETATAQAGDGRYHFTQQFLYLDDYSDTLRPEKDINSQAWAKYAGVDETIAYNYFYTESANNTLPNRLMLKGNKAAVTYLQLAKSIEKSYQPSVYSWEEGSKDSLVLVEAFTKTQQLARSTTDPFLKERYGFQAVKLAMILEQPDNCVKLYDELIKPLKTKTFISDWAFSRKAGATMALGDTAKALYEFAQLFDRCPSRRREADLSLRIKGIRFQEKALGYCQNNAEKAAVYALSAIQPLEDGLPMLKKVTELNPKNALIELITAREINKNEYYANGEMPYVEDTLAYEKRREESKSYFEQLGDFCVENASNKALGNPSFWYTSASYVAYVNKDYKKSEEYLTQAKAAPAPNDYLKQQMDIQEVLLLIAQQEGITPEFEGKVIGMLEKLNKSENFRIVNAYTRACGLLAKMYRGQPTEEKKSGGWWSSCSSKSSGEVSATHLAKAFLLEAAASWQSRPVNADGYAPAFATNSDRYALEDSTSIETLREAISYAKQPQLDNFGKRLVGLSGVNADYLNVVLGRRLLGEHQYVQAAEVWKNVSPKTWTESPFSDYLTENPFYIKPDNGQSPSQTLTPAAFAARMVQLETQMNAGDAQAAYLLGCGAYNMGYFGNSWLLLNRQRSSSEYEYTYPPRDLTGVDYYTSAKAKTYFEKALQLTKDPELAAKAAFGASLCEESTFYVFKANEGRDLGYDEATQVAFKKRMNEEQKKRLGKYFDLLRRNYANSAYTKEIIEECSTYRDFVGQ